MSICVNAVCWICTERSSNVEIFYKQVVGGIPAILDRYVDGNLEEVQVWVVIS